MLKNILLFFLSTIFSILLLETVLKKFNLPDSHRIIPEQTTRFNYLIEKDNSIFWTNKISSEIHIRYDSNPRNYFSANNTVSHKVNSEGFRGSEFRNIKNESLSIAFLGDSFTFGEGVKDHDIFSFKLVQLLNNSSVYSSGFTEFKYGVGGYNIVNTAKLVDSYILQKNPDLYIIQLL